METDRLDSLIFQVVMELCHEGLGQPQPSIVVSDCQGRDVPQSLDTVVVRSRRRRMVIIQGRSTFNFSQHVGDNPWFTLL